MNCRVLNATDLVETLDVLQVKNVLIYYWSIAPEARP